MQPDHHTSKQFDASLDQIRSQVLLMGGLAERQIVYAIEALKRGGDPVLVDRIIGAELEINRLEVSVDEMCTNLIARRAPAAIDLRLIMTAYKTITDLERIGDEAKKIGLAARELRGKTMLMPRMAELQRLAELVIDMLRRSLDALSRLDSDDAPAVIRQDIQVDAEFGAVLRYLLTYMIEDPRTISPAIDLIFVAKALERIGDHAKNISEYVVYTRTGQDVRHVGMDELERVARS